MNYSPEFERFWKLYPKKTGKDKCWAIWQKRIKGMSREERVSFIDQLCDAITKQKHVRKSQLNQNKFVPEHCNPQTWLNGGRWLDETEDVPDLSSPVEIKGHLCQCGKPAVHAVPPFLCAYHLSMNNGGREVLKTFCRKEGLVREKDESRENWLGRLREARQEYFRRFNQRMT